MAKHRKDINNGRSGEMPAKQLKAMGDLQPIVDTKELSFNKDMKLFVGEASSLGFPTGKFPGVVDIRSGRTGAIKSFRLVRTHYDRENELTHVEYQCSEVGCSLHIYND